MAEYIKREDAIDICTKCVDFQDSIDNVNASAEAGRIRRLIKELPSADAVERKHGKWIWQLADNGWADNICSVCGYTINDDIHVHVDYNFCPNCGADMKN